eukprot:jgi/Hompol1/3739/HPOL_003334-RA
MDASDVDGGPDDNDEIPRLPHVTAKTQKERWLTKLERKWLPRVTAYCTANAYNMDALMEHLRRKPARFMTAPKRIDEVIYTPFSFAHADDAPPKSPLKNLLSAQQSTLPLQLPTEAVPDQDSHQSETLLTSTIEDVGTFFDQNIDASGKSIPGNWPYESLAKRIAPVGEILYFDYGVVVMWGLTVQEEHMILNDLEKFEEEHLAYYQPRIYNDIITLKNPANYMLKITISHAIAQSVKLTLFEGLVEETIENTKHVPQIMAEEGKIHMTRKAINQKIGHLFIMRINVNLVSNVLDTPEIFWSEPPLEPLYMAIRGYLEISQRVELLNQRVAVISDLLDMLKEHLNSSHGEQLEWIVIILIGTFVNALRFNRTEFEHNILTERMDDPAFEIIIGIITISVDLSSYLHRK